MKLLINSQGQVFAWTKFSTHLVNTEKHDSFICKNRFSIVRNFEVMFQKTMPPFIITSNKKEFLYFTSSPALVLSGFWILYILIVCSDISLLV